DLVLNAPTESSGVYRYDAAGTLINGGDVMSAGTPVPVLGQDLRDDHPVGVQYAGGGLNWGDITAGNTVADSANDKGFEDPIWNNNRLWVSEVGGDGLPLYNGPTKGPMVECASCHDPHKTTYGSFLRMSNAASALCLACHIK
ncbi:MAG: cytochrome c3 family protein, partial [Hydrogenovibrio sp.]|uniref:cytochrome c3 family protein n=1 Tax=Hydrogenovibrio sp. TaxID=2065821 RepID=UPI00286FB5EE